MLYTVLIVIGILLAAILVFAATKPGAFRVERARSIQAPPERIFDLINDFHRWGLWSPWEKLDPAMKRTFAGAESGKGAVYEWAGNSKAGQGRMEITGSVSEFQDHHQAGFPQAIRSPQHRRVHARPAGRRHQCHLGDVRSPSLHGESDVGICQYGQPDRKRF